MYNFLSSVQESGVHYPIIFITIIVFADTSITNLINNFI